LDTRLNVHLMYVLTQAYMYYSNTVITINVWGRP